MTVGKLQLLYAPNLYTFAMLSYALAESIGLQTLC